MCNKQKIKKGKWGLGSFAKYLNVIKTRIGKGDTNGRKKTKNRGTQTGGDKAGRRTQKRTPARKDDEDT